MLTGIIDLQCCQGSASKHGIGKYTFNLLAHLLQINSDLSLFFLFNTLFPEKTLTLLKKLSLPEDRVLLLHLPVYETAFSMIQKRGSLLNLYSSELAREVFLSNHHPHFILVTSLFDWEFPVSIKHLPSSPFTAVIFYDLIPYLFKEPYLSDPAVSQWYFHRLSQLKRADLIFALSFSARDDLINHLSIPGEKIVVLYGGVDERFVPGERERALSYLRKYGITREFLFYLPSGHDFRKNFENLVRAFALLPKPLRSSFQLVIGSSLPEPLKNHLLSLASSLGLPPDALVFPGYIPDEELPLFYQGCYLFVYPSLYEGLGLPLLEAMNCGAPALGSSTSSIPELLKSEEALFNPYSPEDMARKIYLALTDQNFYLFLKENSLRQVKNFSWQKTARILYETLLSLPILPSQASSSEKPFLEAVQKLRENQSSPKETDLALFTFILARSLPSDRDFRYLLVDVSEFARQDAKSGIQRVVRSQLRELLLSPPEGYQVIPVYLDKQNQRFLYRYARVFLSRFLDEESITLPEEALKALPPEDEEVLFARGDLLYSPDLYFPLAEAFEAGLFYELKLKGVKLAFLIHDLLPLQFPFYFPQGMERVFERWLKAVISVADLLISVSQATMESLKTYLEREGFFREDLKLTYLHHGANLFPSCNKSLSPSPEVSSLLLRLKDKVKILMVGTLEPRKGHRLVLSAFEILWSQGLKDLVLLIVGKEGWLMEDFIKKLKSHPALGDTLFYLGQVKDEDLLFLYQEVDALLMASEGEGFGLPIVEASFYGKHLILRDLPLFRELAGERAFYFENTSLPEVLARSLRKWSSLYREGRLPLPEPLRWRSWSENVEALKTLLLNLSSPKS